MSPDSHKDYPLITEIPYGVRPDDAQIKDLAAYYKENPPEFWQMIKAWADGSPVGKYGSDKQAILEDIVRRCIDPLRPQVRNKYPLVDVGGGDGTLIAQAAPFYGEVYDYDSYGPNESAVREKFDRLGIDQSKLHFIKGDLKDLEVKLTERGLREKISTILGIHLFYYLVYGKEPQAQMIDALRQGFNLLKPWGRSFSVLKDPENGPSSEMYKHFHGQQFELDLSQAAVSLQGEFPGAEMEVNTYIRNVKTIVNDIREGFLAALLVLLHNDKPDAPSRFNFTEQFDEIMKYVRDRFWQTTEEGIIIPQQQDHVLIKKTANE